MANLSPFTFDPCGVYDQSAAVVALGDSPAMPPAHSWAERWQELARDRATPIEQPAWIASCWATVDANRRLATFELTRGEQCMAFAPLAQRRIHGVTRLTMVGVGEIHEPMDVVARDAANLDALAHELVRAGKPLILERLHADSPTIEALERAAVGRAVVVRRCKASCPYISLDASWQEPEKHLNAGRRSDLRRARRKAEARGPVDMQILAPTVDNVDQYFAEAVAVEAASWKGALGSALAQDARRAEFYRHYLHVAAAQGIARICFLRIGEQAVAMQLAVQQCDGYWLLKVGYDDEFSTCSPGQLLLLETIRHAAQAGLSRYEFLGTSETWTAAWTKQNHETLALRIYPHNLRGMTALAIDGARHVVRRWRKT